MTEGSWQQPVGITEALLSEGHHFSFVQVMRLLSAHWRGKGETAPLGRIAIAPGLSLAFPAADVAKVERAPEGTQHRVFVSFLGLYGVASPLPAFYTEELLDEAASDATVRRDFLDVVHRRLYELYYECWCKYRLWHGVGEGDAPLLERLFALIGLAEPELRNARCALDPCSLIRYAGLFGHAPRSCAGLEVLLGDALGGIPVEVVQCVSRRVRIAAEQRLRLGELCCTLGDDALLGEEVDDATGMFRLRIGPVDADTFQRLLPGGALRQRVRALIDAYLTQPLHYDVELILQRDAVQTVRLGSPGSARLGLDSWCFAGSAPGDQRAIISGRG